MVGVTEIEVSTGDVTDNVAEPLIAPEVAVMVAVPCTTPVTNPAPTVAVAGADEVHMAVLVRFCVVPLL